MKFRICLFNLFLIIINEIKGEHYYPLELIVEGHEGPHQDCMGLYVLDGSYSFGFPRYSQKGVQSDLVHYLYRGGQNARWIIVLGENGVAAKQGVLMSDSENGDTPVGLGWDSAQDGAWVPDASLRVLDPKQQQPSQHEERVVMRSEFDAMAKRAMLAESKIAALESDIKTANMFSDELEKNAEDCRLGREQTLKLLSEEIEAKSAHIEKVDELKKEIEMLSLQIVKHQEEKQNQEKKKENQQSKLFNKQEKMEGKHDKQGKTTKNDRIYTIKHGMVEIKMEALMILAGVATVVLLFILFIIFCCCKKRDSTSSSLPSSSSSSLSKKTDDDDYHDDEANNDNERNCSEGGADGVGDDLPARLRSSQATTTAPRPSQVVAGTPSKRFSAGKSVRSKKT